MNKLVAFFEIPATDFGRTVEFYETLFGVTLKRLDCGHEKMAFFPDEDGVCPGAVSWSSEFEFRPSGQGVLVSLNCGNMAKAVEVIEANGGKLLTPKTKIEDDNRGYFCVFLDCEGNRVGLYSDR